MVIYLGVDSEPIFMRSRAISRTFSYGGYQMDNRIITLDNCEKWFYQQPEKFVIQVHILTLLAVL